MHPACCHMPSFQWPLKPRLSFRLRPCDGSRLTHPHTRGPPLPRPNRAPFAQSAARPPSRAGNAPPLIPPPLPLPLPLSSALPPCLPPSLPPSLPACLPPSLPPSLPACLPPSLPPSLSPLLPTRPTPDPLRPARSRASHSHELATGKYSPATAAPDPPHTLTVTRLRAGLIPETHKVRPSISTTRKPSNSNVPKDLDL